MIYNIQGRAINPGIIRDGYLYADDQTTIIGFKDGKWIYTLDGKVIGFVEAN